MSNRKRIKHKINLTELPDFKDLEILDSADKLFRFLDNLAENLAMKREIQNKFPDLLPAFVLWQASRRPYEVTAYAATTGKEIKLYRVFAKKISNQEVYGFKSLIADFSKFTV